MAYILYKSHRGRKLLFQQGRPPKDEAKYVCDNMLYYFISTLFSDDGAYGYLSDVKHVETPISLDVLQQSLEEIDPEAAPPTLSEWLTNYTPAFSTIEEYKKALSSWMSFVFH